MTQKQIFALTDIYSRIKEAEKFIQRDNIKIVHTQNGELTKFIGSELNQLINAKHRLKDFINFHKPETIKD